MIVILTGGRKWKSQEIHQTTWKIWAFHPETEEIHHKGLERTFPREQILYVCFGAQKKTFWSNDEWDIQRKAKPESSEIKMLLKIASFLWTTMCFGLVGAHKSQDAVLPPMSFWHQSITAPNNLNSYACVDYFQMLIFKADFVF